MVLFLACTITFADDRWVMVCSDNEGKVFFDTQTQSVYKSNDRMYINCWIKACVGDYQSVEHYYINTTDLQYMVKERTIYSSNGKTLGSDDLSGEGWKTPTPDSVREIALRNIVIWVSNHTDTPKD